MKNDERASILFLALSRELETLSVWDLAKLKGVTAWDDLPDNIKAALLRIALEYSGPRGG